MFKTIFAVYRFYPMILPKNDFWQKKSSKDKMPRRKGSFGGKKVGKVPQSKTYSTSSQSKSHNKSDSKASTSSGNTSFGSNVASTALGVGAGIMLGNAMSGILNDSNNSPMAHIKESTDNQFSCQTHFETFDECINSNSRNIGSCQWAYDALRKCSNTPVTIIDYKFTW